MQKLLINFMISFVMKQVDKAEAKIDWDKIQAELDEHIQKFFPVKFLDDEIIQVAAVAFKCLKDMLSQEDKIKAIVTLFAQENFDGAAAQLKTFLIDELAKAGSFGLIKYV